VISLRLPSKAAIAACFAAVLCAPAAHAASNQLTFIEAPRDLTGAGTQPATDATRATAFADFQTLGVKALRVNLPWHDVAPSADSPTKPSFSATDPNAYNWGAYGATIDQAKAAGMTVLISLASPVPTWATEAHADTVTRPVPAEFQAFAQAAAQRFGSPTVMWSIWNEPNLPRFLQPQVASGKAVAGRIYRDLFIAGRNGIRAGGQTTAKVLFGEMAPVGGANDTRTYPLAFLRDALCVSKAGKFDKTCGKLTLDGISHHPYQFTNGKLKADDVTYRDLPKLVTAVDKAAKAGAINSSVPIYLTEFGIQSYPDKLLGLPPQSQLEARARVERTAYENKRIKGFSQYLLTDDDSTGGFQTGLVYATGKPKPAFDAFRLTLDAKPVTSKKTSLWGLVRPATAASTVAIEKRSKSSGAFKAWKKVKTKSNGAFTVTDTSSSSTTQYRYRWTSPTGKLTSPYVRVYKGA
jgi:hypothetical protein